MEIIEPLSPLTLTIGNLQAKNVRGLGQILLNSNTVNLPHANEQVFSIISLSQVKIDYVSNRTGLRKYYIAYYGSIHKLF